MKVSEYIKVLQELKSIIGDFDIKLLESDIDLGFEDSTLEEIYTLLGY